MLQGLKETSSPMSTHPHNCIILKSRELVRTCEGLALSHAYQVYWTYDLPCFGGVLYARWIAVHVLSGHLYILIDTLSCSLNSEWIAIASCYPPAPRRHFELTFSTEGTIHHILPYWSASLSLPWIQYYWKKIWLDTVVLTFMQGGIQISAIFPSLQLHPTKIHSGGLGDHPNWTGRVVLCPGIGRVQHENWIHKPMFFIHLSHLWEKHCIQGKSHSHVVVTYARYSYLSYLD